MTWWRKVQQSLRNPSSLKKTAEKNVSFVQKKYRDSGSEDLKKRLSESIGDYEKRARSVPELIRSRSEKMSRQVQKRSQEALSSLSKQAAEKVKVFPIRAAEVSGGTADGQKHQLALFSISRLISC